MLNKYMEITNYQGTSTKTMMSHVRLPVMKKTKNEGKTVKIELSNNY